MAARILLVVLATLLGGSALATPDQYKQAVKGAVQGMTLDEIIQWSNAQFRKSATVGRYVRWGGTILLGSALIYTALDWFYGYLRRETGTSLDQWYSFPDVDVVGGIGQFGVDKVWRYPIGAPSGWYECYQLYRWSVYKYHVMGWTYSRSERVFYANVSSASECVVDVEFIKNHFRNSLPQEYRTWEYRAPREEWANGIPEAHRSSYLSDLSWLRYVLVKSNIRPSLPDWLSSHPDAADGVRNVVTQYVDAHPPASPSSPYPGVQLDPVPNPNQWTDNPFTRPDIDTDGDGYPDSVEWHEANRRGVPWPDVINDPTTHPDPYADPDGDGWTTLEEVQSGTDPYDANSYPGPRRRPVPSTDTDGDGWPDAEEIKRGSDPANPNQYPYNLPYDQDSDGDGVPDWKEIETGTDPYSPESRPEPDPREEEKPEEVQWPGGPPVPGLKEVEFPTREVERRPLPELDRLLQPWEEQVVDRWEQALGQLRSVLADKFPFAIVLAVSQVSISQQGAQCSFPVSIGPVQVTVSPCDTPIFQTAEGFRPILAGLLWLSFVLLMVRRGLDIQG